MSAPGLQIQQVLSLSTGHLTSKTMRALPMLGSLHVAEHHYGVIVSTCHDVESGPELPEDLGRVFEFARLYDCGWIDFDADGPKVEGLPVFEWEEATFHARADLAV